MKGTPGQKRKLTQRSQLTGFGIPSDQEIRRRLLIDALQHPATLVPLTGSAMSLVYLLLVSSVFGGGATSLALLLVCGTCTAASLIWRCFIRYADGYSEMLYDLLEIQYLKQAELERAEGIELNEALSLGFGLINSTKGSTVLESLTSEYDQLQASLERQRFDDPLSLSLLRSLGSEGYRRGLMVLSDALELMNTVQPAAREQTERALTGIEKEIEAAKGGGSQEGWRQIKEGRMDHFRTRLKTIDRLLLRADQLLFQAERCESSLHHTRMEIAGIRTGSSETGVDSAIQALKGTIHQVKEAQEELKRLGY